MAKEIIVEVRPFIKKMQLIMQKTAEARLMSRYRAIFKGKGLEFEDFRTYSSEEDDATRIDWKASTRANKLLIRQFKEERDLDIIILLDVSASMVFGSTKKLKSEFAAELAGALTYVIIETGDRPGLFMFSDKIVKKIPPASSRDQYYMILKAMIDPKYYGGKGCDIESAISFLMTYTSRRGVLVIISDFFGLKEGWTQGLKIASAKFDVICMMVRDVRDEILPRGVGKIMLLDPFSNKELLVDPDLIYKDYQEYAKKQRDYIKHVCIVNNADFLELRVGDDFVKPILTLLKRRERELA